MTMLEQPRAPPARGLCQDGGAPRAESGRLSRKLGQGCVCRSPGQGKQGLLWEGRILVEPGCKSPRESGVMKGTERPEDGSTGPWGFI